MRDLKHIHIPAGPIIRASLRCDTADVKLMLAALSFGDLQTLNRAVMNVASEIQPLLRERVREQ